MAFVKKVQMSYITVPYVLLKSKSNQCSFLPESLYLKGHDFVNCVQPLKILIRVLTSRCKYNVRWQDLPLIKDASF